MPGVLLGSVVLIGTWVVVQNGASGRVEQAGNVFVGLLRRLMSPSAAGLGNHSAPASTGKPAANGGGGRPPSFY